MKSRIIYFIIALIVSFSNVYAQLPEISTADNPIWYYIQVIGESDRAELVFTAESGKVCGRSMIVSTDESKIKTQLWRFEKENNNYVIINMSTGTKVSLDYNTSKSIRYAALSETPTTTWDFPSNGKGYNIKAVTNISTGSTSNIYAHQANDWDGRGYVIMFESSTYQSNNNSRFNFIKYEKLDIEYSTDDNEVWYFIKSAYPEYADKCITDVVDASLANIKFSLTDKENENYNQQWKLVKKSSSSSEKRVHIINRATQNIIQTKSKEEGFYKYTQSTTNKAENNGWVMTYLGEKQFEISGTETDNVTRRLSASNAENKQPEFYDEASVLNTSFAWFIEAVDKGNSIISPDLDENIKVYSQNGYIIVVGTEDYSIYTIQGNELQKNKQLPFGIYLVKIGKGTIKILIK
ncbi:hypothetical protein M2138_002057 [Dysgonomonadaceae bacterium PH5-43]|nr:hypothetical protein [Dysgonomonadaceae bacterium PH5-43]